VIHIYNRSTQEGEAGGPQVQSQTVLRTKFEVSLGFTERPCL
jgi:hypothetical protein